MIDINNMTFSYGEGYVFREFNMKIAKNEIVAVMGASGSGKTTLMDIISGLKKPQKGRIMICSTDIYKLKERQLEKFKLKNIGYIFQKYNLIPYLSVFDNIMLPAMIVKDRRKEVVEFGCELLNRLNLVHKKDELPEKLSGGEQQRVAIARALIMSPQIILADEPTGALDAENTQRFMEYFINLVKLFDSTAIVVTHDEKVAAFCSRIIKLG